MKYEKSTTAKKHNGKSSNPKRQSGISLCLCAFIPLCFIFSSGCGQQPKEIIKEVSIPETKTSQITRAAEDVLTEMHFSIEKLDYENGYIKTRPLSGAQFFEFWRSDNIGTDNWIQANIHNVRRTVELFVNQQDRTLNIDCDVQIQRLSLPGREIPGSAQAYQLFTRSSMLMQTLRLHPELEIDMVWINLGKDTKLEKEIVKRISSMINREYQETSNKGQTTRDEL